MKTKISNLIKEFDDAAIALDKEAKDNSITGFQRLIKLEKAQVYNICAKKISRLLDDVK